MSRIIQERVLAFILGGAITSGFIIPILLLCIDWKAMCGSL